MYSYLQFVHSCVRVSHDDTSVDICQDNQTSVWDTQLNMSEAMWARI